MKTLLTFILWALLLVLCWPLAILVLILWPVLWLLSIPFRLVGVLMNAILALAKSIFFSPPDCLATKAHNTSPPDAPAGKTTAHPAVV